MTECEDAPVYGYNLDGVGICEDDDITIDDYLEFE